MGLDMYAYSSMIKPVKEVGAIFEGIGGEDDTESSEFFYWRKHPNLHGWMEALYRKKGGHLEFNCQPVVLTEKDLDRLEEAIKAGELPDTNGFFFGESEGDEDEVNQDLEFIKEARSRIKDGMTVWYDSWW